MTKDAKPRDGEVRQTKCEATEDGWRIEYTQYMKPRVILQGSTYVIIPSE